MAERYNTLTGLSDHTLGIGVAIASIAMGACIIEKHITLDRSGGGVDAAFSLEPTELKNMVREVFHAWSAQGVPQLVTDPGQLKSAIFKRSFYASEDIAVGETITEHNVRIIRPALGIPANQFIQVYGATARVSVKKGTPLHWDMLL